MPTVTSRTSSMPEITRDAALLVNPYETDEIAEAMHKVLEDHELREKLVKRGLLRAQQFTIEKAARGTLMVYEDAMKQRAKSGERRDER